MLLYSGTKPILIKIETVTKLFEFIKFKTNKTIFTFYAALLSNKYNNNKTANLKFYLFFFVNLNI